MDTQGEWRRDPTGRHLLRYWDGNTFTRHVSDGGDQQSEDDGPLPSSRDMRRKAIKALASDSKYQMPLEQGKFASMSVLGGSWNEYAETALTAMLLETLLDIDEKLERLLTELPVSSEAPPEIA